MNLQRKAIRQGIMKAEDMFSDKMLQVFSRKTGEYLGYVYLGQDPELLQEKIEDQEQKIVIPKSQLSLF